MGDVFKEQLIKKHPTLKDLLLKTLIGIGFIITTAAVMILIPQLLPIIILVLGFLVFYLYGMLNLEYEYIFTNGELDIDCIYNKRKRKNVFSANMRSVEIMTHFSNDGHVSLFGAAQVTKDFSSQKPDNKENVYAFLVQYDGKKTMVIFEPNEKLLSAMALYIDKRKFIKVEEND